jgi:hypothetical protein
VFSVKAVHTIKAYGQVQLRSFLTSTLDVKPLVGLTTQLV